jgi:hypothetical protein
MEAFLRRILFMLMNDHVDHRSKQRLEKPGRPGLKSRLGPLSWSSTERTDETPSRQEGVYAPL